MARDYRHGHSSKQGFQRKSQQGGGEEEKRSISFFWSLGFFLAIVVLVIYFTTQHFASNKASVVEPSDQSSFQAAIELKQDAAESIEKISQQLQPKPIIVEEVAMPTSKQIETSVEAKKSYSFYQGLGQTEVIVEAEPISVQMKQPYYIQAGSFGSETVAKQELKRLRDRGQELQLSALHKRNRTYYRLRAGPFTDRLLMNKRRNELRRLGVDTLLIKASLPKSTAEVLQKAVP